MHLQKEISALSVLNCKTIKLKVFIVCMNVVWYKICTCSAGSSNGGQSLMHVDWQNTSTSTDTHIAHLPVDLLCIELVI